MSFLLWAGTIVGAACGLGHGAYVYNLVSREASKVNSGAAVRPKAIAYAIWTLALWVLFGVYVTVLWVVACCFYIPSRLLGRQSTLLPGPRRAAFPGNRSGRANGSYFGERIASKGGRSERYFFGSSCCHCRSRCIRIGNGPHSAGPGARVHSLRTPSGTGRRLGRWISQFWCAGSARAL